jgi:hypothetical protein
MVYESENTFNKQIRLILIKVIFMAGGSWRKGKSIKDEGKKTGSKKGHDPEMDPLDPKIAKIINREIKKDEAERSERAIKQDRAKAAEQIYDPAIPAEVEAWQESKNRSDLAGVDADYLELARIKATAATEIHQEIERIEKVLESNLPISAKAQILEDSKATVKAIVKKSEEGEREIVERKPGKWSPERKKTAMMVHETVGTKNVIEADALVQRALRAGFEPDLVNWDAVQGGDLKFSEKVEKLDAVIGKPTEQKKEVDALFNNEASDYERQYNTWIEGIKTANFHYGKDHDARPIKVVIADMKELAPLLTDAPEDWKAAGPVRADLMGYDDVAETEEQQQFIKDHPKEARQAANVTDLSGESDQAKPKKEKKTKKGPSEPAKEPDITKETAIEPKRVMSDAEKEDVVLNTMRRATKSENYNVNKGVEYEELMKEGERQGMSKQETEEVINNLIDKGDIWEPYLGRMKLTD